MPVNFDLLGNDRNKEELAARRLNPVLFCVFLLLITLAAVIYEYSLLHNLYEKRRTAEAELRSVKAGNDELSARLGEADVRLKEVEEVFDFMLGDIRAIEVLSTLTVCREFGVSVEKLEITPEKTTLSGVAKSEREISGLYGVLVSSGFFSAVSRSETASGVHNGFTFTLQCRTADVLVAGMTND